MSDFSKLDDRDIVSELISCIQDYISYALNKGY